jgi:predicted TPR repeat methyltransferase
MVHMLTALKGGESECAPNQYVEALFDGYAPNFDSHLVRGLSYNVPEKLADVLRPRASVEGERWTVLDLGCGTGLAGSAIASFSRTLVGVDLSSKMLEKAKERRLYDRLEQSDVLAMMRAEPSEAYDLVIAADVFVYVGKLEPLVFEVHRLLRPGGLFGFSVESLDAVANADAEGVKARGYRLNDTGSYCHSADYLARLCEQAGFGTLSTISAPPRVHHGEPVEGYLVLWKKAAADSHLNASAPTDYVTRGRT